jgi:hypothetical protein
MKDWRKSTNFGPILTMARQEGDRYRRAMPKLVTFHVYPNPPDGKVIMVEVTEGRMSGGTFEVTADAWVRIRRCISPGPGLRIRDYPP